MTDETTPDPTPPLEPIPGDMRTAIVRTVVPFITAAIVAWLAERGLDADTESISAMVIAVGGSLWYTVIRVLERKWPQVGWLLGSPKIPTYPTPE